MPPCSCYFMYLYVRVALGKLLPLVMVDLLLCCLVGFVGYYVGSTILFEMYLENVEYMHIYSLREKELMLICI